jgi:hypothetical protein
MRILALVLLSSVALAAQPSSTGTLVVPNRVNSTPWVAAAGSFVAVAWGAAANGKGDIFLAVSRDGGRVFSPPVRVNSVEGDARISGEIAPRVALLARSGVPDPLITVTWNAKDGTTQIRTARSRDGGRTFTGEKQLQTRGAIGDRGWQASALDSRGTLHTIWLDHRAIHPTTQSPRRGDPGMAAAKASGDQDEHKGAHDGVAMAQRSGLYYAADGAPERELFKGVCYCCKTAMAIGPKGEIYAAWRHVFAGSMRDMGFTMSRDGGRTFTPLTRVSQDGGPAMAVDAKGTVHLVWPTVKDEQGVILYATSQDGRTFTTPRRLPGLGSRKPSHPQIAIASNGSPVVAWDEVLEGVRHAAIHRIGDARPAHVIGASTSYPVMAATDTGVVAVWTAGPRDRATIGVRVIQLTP